MESEENSYSNTGQAWQDLFDKAQAAWMDGDEARAYEYYSDLMVATTPFLLAIAGKQAAPSVAEDIVARAYLELSQKMEQGTQVDNVVGLLRTITKCRSIDALRNILSEKDHTEDSIFWARQVAPDNVENETINRLDSQGIINPLLNELSPDLRKVLLARLVDEMSVEETAQSLGLTVDQVKKRKREALKHLQVNAKQKGLLP